MYNITIQDSFEEVIRDVENELIKSEKFWLARIDDQAQLQYFKINVHLTEGKTLQFEGESELKTTSINFKMLAPHKYSAAIEDESGTVTYTLISPRLKKSFKGNKITLAEFDPSLNSAIFQGTLNGNIIVYDQNSWEEVGVINRAHLSSVTHLILLPSGKVLLSVGDDFRICLWDLGAEEVPKDATRAFMNQTKTITDVALIGRGRNFISASEDGSVLIWECSSQCIVTEFRRVTNRTDPAKCIAVTTSDNEPEENQFRANLLFDCAQKVLFVGYELGLIQQYSIARNCPTDIKLHGSAPVTSMSISKEFLIAGYANGLIMLWDWKKGTTRELQLNQNQAVEHIFIRAEQPNLSFIVSNGPEALLQIDFDDSQFTVSYLVGLQEMFHVLLTGNCISTSDEVAIF